MTVFRKLTEEEQQKLGLSNLDVLLSTRASEETLRLVQSLINSIESKVSTEEKQDAIISTIESLKNTTEENVATKQNQFTQLDLLNLIYEELQAQTKLLKKIYQ